MRPLYIHEREDWPRFRWAGERLAGVLAEVRYRQGRLTGHLVALGLPLRQEAQLKTLTEDVLGSSEIEGERLDAEQVRSSVARRLGMEIGALEPADRHVDGFVEIMIDATRQYDRPLTEERLFGWHAALFPTGRSGMRKIRVGAWRDESGDPMEVVSGPVGKERVRFEAPAAGRLPAEMTAFLDWFDRDSETDPVLHAALAHLWFVTLHPFDDGNGRIGRAILDMALARADGEARRSYSMSRQIEQERRAYYGILEHTQKGSMDVTAYLVWFLECLLRAVDGTEDVIAAALTKARFWKRHAREALNERQIQMITRLLGDFKGKLTSSKWAKISKCSQDTAVRDISDLVDRGILDRNPGGGRSTSYSLVLP